MLFPGGPRMSQTVTDVEVHDIRFPTSLELDGSDAMNPDPDYSAAYVVLRTDAPGGPDGGLLEGHGFCFTIGRGNDVMAVAIEALKPYLLGRPLPRTAADLGDLYRELTHDSQLRWLGPEKGSPTWRPGPSSTPPGTSRRRRPDFPSGSSSRR